MKKRRFSLEQIVGVLKKAEVGVPAVAHLVCGTSHSPLDRSGVPLKASLTRRTRCDSRFSVVI